MPTDQIFTPVGGLVYNSNLRGVPIICGGDFDISMKDACYSFQNDRWAKSAKLTDRTGYTNAVQSPFGNTGLFIAGGYNSAPMSTSQHFQDSEWNVGEANLPEKMWLHCTIKLDETTILVTGGVQGISDYEKKTFILNTYSRHQWTAGNKTCTIKVYIFKGPGKPTSHISANFRQLSVVVRLG